MTRWSELYQKFKALGDITGREKSSSYVMNLIFTPEDEISVELGCYDISDWPRHLMLGPFPTEQAAFDAAEKKVNEAIEAVKKQQEEDGCL